MVYFNKFALVSAISVVVGSVNAFSGVARHFDNNALPADFTPCGGNCPPVSNFTLRIALPSDLFNGADSCCSTFTLTFDGKTTQGTYAYKSSSIVGTQSLVLQNELFDRFADHTKVEDIFPVNYVL